MISILRHWKNYLLLLLTCSYGIGIVSHSSEIFSETIFQVALGCFLVALLFIKFRCRRICTFGLVVIIFFFFGAIQGSRHSLNIIDRSHVAVLVEDQQRIAVVGTLAEMVSEFRNTSRARIDVRFIRTEAEPAFKKSTGKLLIIVKGSWPETILPGKSIIFQATAQIPPSAAAPGAFNYRKYLARKKIYMTALVNSPILVQPIEDIQATWPQNFIYAIERSRTRIASYMGKSLPSTSAALYKALIVGDRMSIDPEVMENLKRAGVLHLWAISGMHLGLLTALTYSSLYWLLRRSEKLLLKINVKKMAIFLTLPPLLFYAMLAGFQPPAARAFIMTSCLVISLGFDRLHSPITILAGAAFIILLVDPLAIQSPSFQLSFSAVAAIVLVAPKILSYLNFFIGETCSAGNRVRNLIVSLVAVTLSATLGTLPLLLCHFNRLSFVTLPANLLVQPVICFFSLPLGLLSLPFILLYPPAAEFMLNCGALGLTLANTSTRFISAPEWTQLWLPDPHPVLVIIYYMLLLMFADQRSSPFSSVLKTTALVAVTLTILMPLQQHVRGIPQKARVTILAVGHGSANLIEFNNGRVVLIDGGSRSAPGFDCGARIISPYLWHNKIRKVDDIIITHEDADHYNGIFTVMKRFRPDRLWLPPLDDRKRGFSQLIDHANNHDIEIIAPNPGVLVEEMGNQILLLGKELDDALENEDDRGLVLKFSSGAISVLFPGDITKEREMALVGSERRLESTILLSPHHGSATSNSFALLSEVSPEILIFSSGKSKKFPSKEVLATAQKLSITTLNTAEVGTIIIEIDDEGYACRLPTANDSQDSYWRNG